MRKILAMLLLLYTIPSYAEELSLQDFAERVISFSEGLSGHVVEATSKQVIIDLGKNKNIVIGIPFEISRQGEELRHPITNELLGRKSISIANGEVIKVEGKFSTLLVDKNGAKKGDIVSFSLPLKLKFSFKNMAPREESEIKFNILQDKNILEDSAAHFEAGCERRKEGDTEAICTLKYRNNIIFVQNSSVRGYKILKAGGEMRNDSTFLHIAKEKIRGEYSSVAIGYLHGKDNSPTVALATKSKVFIYEYKEGVLKEVQKLGSFKDLVNIEIIDIDNDSIDELLISNLDKEKSAKSAIYSFDGKKLIKASQDIPLLFRTFYGDNRKVALCQEYSKGIFIGKLYELTFNKEKKIEKKDLVKINQTYAKLYGSAYTNEKQSFSDILYFNEKGSLNMQDGANNQYTVEYNFFSETNNFIMLKEDIDAGITVGTEGGGKGFFVHDTRSYATFIYQRIIRLPSGAYIMYTNIPKKRSERLSKYENAKVGEYMLSRGKIHTLFEEEYKNSFIVEVDITSTGELLTYLEDGDEGSILRIAKL